MSRISNTRGLDQLGPPPSRRAIGRYLLGRRYKRRGMTKKQEAEYDARIEAINKKIGFEPLTEDRKQIRRLTALDNSRPGKRSKSKPSMPKFNIPDPEDET